VRVQILIGKLSAHCPECYGEEWASVDGSESPEVTDDVVCLGCGHRVMCADLVLQLPIDETLY
jgi:DNA-directed RNA polymerase subunit RPC12/RpoP